MNRLAIWFWFLLLALSSSSCLSSSLHDWACEELPQSEVQGFIESAGGGALIIRVDGEKGMADGLYEVPVVSDGSEQSVSKVQAPTLLSDADVKALQPLSTWPQWTAHLDALDWSLRSALLPIDEFKRVNGVLSQVNVAEPVHFVSVKTQVKSEDGRSFTKLVLHSMRSPKRHLDAQGVAYLPPARRKTSRVIVAIVAAPVAVAIDVVAFPVELVVGAMEVARMGEILGKALARAFFIPIFIPLTDTLAATFFVIDCIPALLVPGLGGWIVQLPKESLESKL